jgi:hypothetical protein
MVSFEEIKQDIESEYKSYYISDYLDYLETCVSENLDFNGSSLIKFDTLADLIYTYFDGIDLDETIYTAIYIHAQNRPLIMSIIK